jgi:hypothetical protein
MTLRVAVRDDVMNLNAVIASADRAPMTVAFKRNPTDGLPLGVIRSGFPAAPEVGLRSALALGLQFGIAGTGANHTRLTSRAVNLFAADDTCGSDIPRSVPSSNTVTGRRAIPLRGQRRRHIERLTASLAGLVRAVAWLRSWLPLQPRAVLLAGCSEPAFLRAITRAAPEMHRATPDTNSGLSWWSHAGSIADAWTNAEYAAMARKRIAGDAPLLAVVS